jgi:hypothetical protein
VNGHSECRLAGETHHFELPEGAIRSRRELSNVNGCGLMLDLEDKLSIFFTLNGKLMGMSLQKVLMIKKKSLMYF